MEPKKFQKQKCEIHQIIFYFPINSVGLCPICTRMRNQKKLEVQKFIREKRENAIPI